MRKNKWNSGCGSYVPGPEIEAYDFPGLCCRKEGASDQNKGDCTVDDALPKWTEVVVQEVHVEMGAAIGNGARDHEHGPDHDEDKDFFSPEDRLRKDVACDDVGDIDCDGNEKHHHRDEVGDFQ